MGQGTVTCEDTAEPERDNTRMSSRRKKLKVLSTMTVAVTLGALGDISLSRGMKLIGAKEYHSLLHAFLVFITNPYILSGIALMISFLVLYLISLSWEELSYVLPLTAADYILVTIFAFFLLHEHVPPMRWAGSALVAIGIYVVARS